MPLIHGAGREAALPKDAGRAFAPIDLAGMAPIGLADRAGKRLRLRWLEHKVEVIGHQTRRPAAHCRFRKQRPSDRDRAHSPGHQKRLLTPFATQGNVMRIAGKNNVT